MNELDALRSIRWMDGWGLISRDLDRAEACALIQEMAVQKLVKTGLAKWYGERQPVLKLTSKGRELLTEMESKHGNRNLR